MWVGGGAGACDAQDGLVAVNRLVLACVRAHSAPCWAPQAAESGA